MYLTYSTSFIDDLTYYYSECYITSFTYDLYLQHTVCWVFRAAARWVGAILLALLTILLATIVRTILLALLTSKYWWVLRAAARCVYIVDDACYLTSVSYYSTSFTYDLTYYYSAYYITSFTCDFTDYVYTRAHFRAFCWVLRAHTAQQVTLVIKYSL